MKWEPRDYQDFEDAVLRQLRKQPWFTAYIRGLVAQREARLLRDSPRWQRLGPPSPALTAMHVLRTPDTVAAGSIQEPPLGIDGRGSPGRHRLEVRTVVLLRKTRTAARSYRLATRLGRFTHYDQLVLN